MLFKVHDWVMVAFISPATNKPHLLLPQIKEELHPNTIAPNPTISPRERERERREGEANDM
jgi:hypothetical protein